MVYYDGRVGAVIEEKPMWRKKFVVVKSMVEVVSFE